MGILSRDPSADYQRVARENSELRSKIKLAETERDAALQQLDGRKDLMWWVTCKVHRQSSALDDLNRRVTSLRFAVKVMESILGRPVTRDEWVAARNALSNEAHKDRIDAEPVSA